MTPTSLRIPSPGPRPPGPAPVAKEAEASVAAKDSPLPSRPSEIPIHASTGSMPPPPPRIPLLVGDLDDPAEREADRSASDALGGGPTARFGGSIPVDSTRSARTAPSEIHHALRSPGTPLDLVTRRFMEQRFGQDFSGVRVHTDTASARSAESLQARAYTVGSDIVFATGQYAPQRWSGKRLIAHELAHVGQTAESGTPVLRRKPVSDPLEDVPPEEKYFSHPLEQTPAPPAPPDPAKNHEEHQIAAFDTTKDSKRPWNLNKLTKDVVTALQSDPRAYVRIFGAYPTVEGDDDPKQNAWDRANLVKKALIQWIGPGRFAEDRFEVAFATGRIGDPQIQVDIAYKPQILSSPTTPLPATPPTPAKLDPSAGNGGGDDLQSALGGQWTWHLNRTGKVERTVALQLTQGSGTAQAVYQFQVNLDTGDVQALVGAQIQKESKTVSVLKGALKVKASVFLDLLAGITTAKGEASGSITFQVQAGAQVSATFGPVTVALQAAPSITYQAGQPISVDFNLAPQAGQDSLPKRTLPPFIGIPLIVGTF